MKTTGVAMVLLLVSCSTGAGIRLRDLPAPERDAMERCAPAIRRYGACAPDQDRIGVAQDACMNQVEQRYATLPDGGARKDFLVESGCPEDTVAALLQP